MNCVVKEYVNKAGAVLKRFEMNMRTNEAEAIKQALMDAAGASDIPFETRALLVDMVRSINKPEHVKVQDD